MTPFRMSIKVPGDMMSDAAARPFASRGRNSCTQVSHVVREDVHNAEATHLAEEMELIFDPEDYALTLED